MADFMGTGQIYKTWFLSWATFKVNIIVDIIVNKKTVGIIGPGKHFKEKIYPILIKSNFFNIQGILRRKKIGFEKIKYLNEKEFFKKKFDFVYISCPNKQHENYILKSLTMGSHVICEKPFILRKKKLIKLSIQQSERKD